jgi:formylglycine-generating enzyme required for sulfatase activity
MKMTVKMAWVSFAVCFALGAAADTGVSDVVVRQRWPWSRLVDIDYVLIGEAGQKMDVTLKAYDGQTALTLPANSLSGDLYGATPGARKIVWDPTKSAYTNELITRFKVELTANEAPLYMIVDLTKTAGVSGQTEYVYETDLTNNLWGSWVRNPVTNNGTVVESIVWTGVTTNDIYKTDKLVLRRVSAGSFVMGSSGTITVTLTKDFYAGVFEITQRQWEFVTGARPSYFSNAVCYATRPVEQVSYEAIRGGTNAAPDINVNWPSTGYKVASGSFLGLLRNKTGLDLLDLPTLAQWEYLCRAGTTTLFNDGDPTASASGDYAYTNQWLNVLSRYAYNGGLVNGTGTPSQTCSLDSGSAAVGAYRPNAWGLYDTLGNVFEASLDWGWSGPSSNAVDPVGPADASEQSADYLGKRANQGGGAASAPSYLRVYNRNKVSPTTVTRNLGLRIVLVLQ